MNKKYIIGLTLIFCIFFTGLFFFSFTKYYNYYSDNFDTAIFNQVFWSLINNGNYYEHINAMNFIQSHFSPGLVLFIPFFLFCYSVFTIKFIQPLIMALAVIPLFYLAQKITKIGSRAIIIVLCYICFAPIYIWSLHPFFTVTLIGVFIFSFFYFYNCGKKKTSLLILFLLMLLKENMLYFPILLIIYFYKKKDLKFYYQILFFYIFYFIFKHFLIAGLQVSQPLHTHYPYFHIYFKQFGTNFIEAISTILINPISIIIQLLHNNNFYFLFFLLAYFLYLPLLKFEIIIAGLLYIIYMALGDYSAFHNPYYKYISPLFHIIFISFIFGYNKLLKITKHNKLLNILVIFWIFLMFFTHIYFGINNYFNKKFLSNKYRNNYKKCIRLISDQASVLTSERLMPYIAFRKHIVRFINYNKKIDEDYILLDSENLPTIDYEKADGINLARIIHKIAFLITQGNYSIIYFKQNLMLLKKKYKPQPVLLSDEQKYFLDAIIQKALIAVYHIKKDYRDISIFPDKYTLNENTIYKNFYGPVSSRKNNIDLDIGTFSLFPKMPLGTIQFSCNNKTKIIKSNNFIITKVAIPDNLLKDGLNQVTISVNTDSGVGVKKIINVFKDSIPPIINSIEHSFSENVLNLKIHCSDNMSGLRIFYVLDDINKKRILFENFYNNNYFNDNLFWYYYNEFYYRNKNWKPAREINKNFKIKITKPASDISIYVQDIAENISIRTISLSDVK